jgi:benzil reductase ((S)-benzoin forming)
MPSAYIVTGTTRGIGRSLAREILCRGDDRLFTLSRAPDGQEGAWRNFHCDLGFAEQVEQAMRRLLAALDGGAWRQIVLISNAGVLGPIAFLDRVTSAQAAAHLQVNVLAPIALMRLFIDHTRGWPCRRSIIAITSGAARHPYAGWSLYCGAKAALEMVLRCAALEQQTQPNGMSLCAVAPGVVDTDMQAEIRNAADADFPLRSQFVRFQQSGNLATPEWVAATLLDLHRSGQLKSGAVYDLRDVQWLAGRPTITPGSGE